MKLRIRGNSIRLRLSRGEVAQFGTTGEITEKTVFGQSNLIYTLRTSSEAKELSANFADNEIIVTLPDKLARDWVESNEVGIEAEQIISSSEILKISVEKDFVCLDRPGDVDNEDAYPHPSINC
ncbi:MAG: hypothetical protein ABI954_13535 [Pyrinomonadaceae bacterium]